jgi:mannan polymerase II complex MNN11 subunit
MRHAMTQFPKTPYFFHLDDHTLIANPNIAVEKHLTDGERIESLAIRDIPVVPPDSVIKTLTGVSGDHVDLLLVQDKEGLSVNSFVLRSGDWARYFLDTWFDPLYRQYNFQKAERHALEHIVQCVFPH